MNGNLATIDAGVLIELHATILDRFSGQTEAIIAAADAHDLAAMSDAMSRSDAYLDCAKLVSAAMAEVGA